MQELPKFHETFNPILEVLRDGKTLSHRELLREVVERFYQGLPKELQEQKTKSGDSLLFNRITWGKSYLKKGGFVHYPKRGQVQITDKGKSQLSKLTLKDVESSSDFFEFYEDENAKGITPSTDIKSSTPQDLIDRGISEIESKVRDEMLERLKGIDPYYFEKVILILLKRMGYGDFEETPKSNDGGIDGVINEDKLGLDKIYIQAKRYDQSKVREKDIRNFIGAMSGDTTKGIFVTTSTFDKGAVEKAKSAHHTIVLIDGERLAKLMHQYNVGVQLKNTYEVKEIDSDFFEGET